MEQIPSSFKEINHHFTNGKGKLCFPFLFQSIKDWLLLVKIL